MFYAITGKLRSGKSLFALTLVKQALLEDRRVATNFDLFLDHLVPARNASTVYRLPDHPSANDLEVLGPAYEGDYDERKNGILLLDEVSHFLSARRWNEAGRADILAHLTHTGKLGWDVYLIAQNVDMIDSLARSSFLESTIRVRNASRQTIPFIGGFLRSLGIPHYLPRFHIAVARYGTAPDAPVSEKWMFRGSDFFAAYDTRQLFGEVTAPYCYLSHWHLAGRYLAPRLPLWHYPIAIFLVLVVYLALLLRLVQPNSLPPSFAFLARD